MAPIDYYIEQVKVIDQRKVAIQYTLVMGKSLVIYLN